MGSWWRSEEMTYVSLILSEDAAPACIAELGALGCMQFTDMNPEQTPFQRRHVASIKRCDEIERKIRYINGEMKKMDVSASVASNSAIDEFVDSGTFERGGDKSTGAFVLEDLDGKLDVYEKQLLELNKFGTRLIEEYISKVELHHVLTKIRTLFLAEMNTIAHDSVDEGNYIRRDTEEGVSLHAPNAYAASGPGELAFSNIAGVLPNADRIRFERMLFRATRGNCWVRFAPIDESDTLPGSDSDSILPAPASELSSSSLYQEKTVFIIFYKSQSIQSKIKRICDAFYAHCYDIQSLDRPADLRRQEDSNARDLQEAKLVMNKNIATRKKTCQEASVALEEWLWVVRREKSIYHTLNLFKSNSASNMVRGRGWIVTSETSKAQNALHRAHTVLNLPTSAILEKVPNRLWPTPPTHFNTNKYTDGYQEFVNTYGIPRYREINPALFTAATFPFLFGIMYGDIGHGTCLLLFGLFLILTEKSGESRTAGEMVQGIYGARYMLFAMGLCAVYAGTVYNDYFSLGLNIFTSNYEYVDRTDGAEAEQKGYYGETANVYPYGIDPAWKIADNNLLFFNSFKMKLSVVLGITQMTLGICLKGMNAIYFKQYLDFTCEFIPMILFDMCFFGYMVVLIFVKWSINWDHRMRLGTCGYTEEGEWGVCTLAKDGNCFTFDREPCDATTQLVDMCPLGMGGTSNGCQPPNLITTLMNMALSPGTVDEPLFHGQANLQLLLLGLAFICVPWLLCAKPMILKQRHEAEEKERDVDVKARLIDDNNDLIESDMIPADAFAGSYSTSAHSSSHHALDVEDRDESYAGELPPSGGDGHGHGEEFNYGEVVIHQAIETIEFVLGMVSNTASYLRLWALSLAHSELAEVFWEKALLGMINTGNPVAIYIGFAVFAAVTFAVLLCMDVLECFLHALRLHWVEFQNKFYKADGYRFQPFDFKAIVAKAMLE